MNAFSLRIKLIMPIFLLMAAIFFIAQWVSYEKDVRQNEKRLVERVQVLSKGVSYNLQAAILFDDQLTAQDILSAFEVDKDVLRVKLYDRQSQLFALYEKEGTNARIPTEDERVQIRRSGYVIADRYMYMYVPIILHQEMIASLRVTISTSSFQEIYNTALNDSAYFISILFLCGVVLYLLVQKMIVKPVYRLNGAMKSFIENGQSRPELSCQSKDEIGDLVLAFNTMLEQIETHEEEIVLALEKLNAEKTFVNDVLDTVQHALLVVDSQGKILLSNDEASNILGRSIIELRGASIQHTLNVHGSSVIEQALCAELQLEDELFLVEEHNPNAQKQILKISTRPLSGPEQILFAVEDVTEVELALGRQRLAAGIFENSKDGLILLDSQSNITMVNPAVTQLLGYDGDQLVNKPIDEVLMWPQFGSLLPVIRQSLDDFGHWQGEVWEQHCDGHLVPLFVKVNRIPAPDYPAQQDMVIMISDLSNIKEMERLEHMAHHDALTGLANRSKLYRVLNEVIIESRKSNYPFSLLYLDLDGFKQVNDTYGHAAGDEVLKQVSKRLLSQVRSQDLVARLSGDEFVVLITQSERSSVKIMSERLIKLIEQDIIYRSKKLSVGASIGVYFVESFQQDIDTMLKTADKAMYEAKSLGKGQLVIIDDKN